MYLTITILGTYCIVFYILCNLLLRNASQFVASSSGACFQGRAERYLVGKGGGAGILKNMEHRHQYFYYKNVGDGRGGGGAGMEVDFLLRK